MCATSAVSSVHVGELTLDAGRHADVVCRPGGADGAEDKVEDTVERALHGDDGGEGDWCQLRRVGTTEVVRGEARALTVAAEDDVEDPAVDILDERPEAEQRAAPEDGEEHRVGEGECLALVLV
jgi:hypothetical protein